MTYGIKYYSQQNFVYHIKNDAFLKTVQKIEAKKEKKWNSNSLSWYKISWTKIEKKALENETEFVSWISQNLWNQKLVFIHTNCIR